MGFMLYIVALGILLLNPKPFMEQYDKIADMTYRSTEVLGTDGRTQAIIGYRFKGHVPARPTEGYIRFVTWHNNPSGDIAQDRDYTEWLDVDKVTLNINGQALECKAIHTASVTTDYLVGRTVRESEDVTLPIATFLGLGDGPLLFRVGQTSGAFKAKTQGQIKTMLASIPAE